MDNDNFVSKYIFTNYNICTHNILLTLLNFETIATILQFYNKYPQQVLLSAVKHFCYLILPSEYPFHIKNDSL